MKRALVAVTAVMLAAPLPLQAQQSQMPGTCLDCGVQPHRVLMIGAHPDDEDTNLIAWLQRGGRAETAYLSLTRGDGGQNLIGNELGEQLGIIRTEELLAARRVDGAHQFFTRAYDFGFSKSAEETYAHWPKDSLLNDVVTIVRAWKPHVIIRVFTGTPRDGHGQHQVSALLATEAFELAGDTVRFPVKDFGPAWTPLKLYRLSRFNPDEATLKMNVGEYNPALGRSYAEIAGESRSQHKSQGFGALQRKGVVWNYVHREASRVNESMPATAEKSMFDGIPVPSLAKQPVESAAEHMRHVSLEAIADRQYLAVGDSAQVVATLYNRSRSTIRVKPVESEGLALASSSRNAGTVAVLPDSSFRWVLYMKGREVTRPWWLATPRIGDLFSPPIPRLRRDSDWLRTPEDERQKTGWAAAMITTGNSQVAHEERSPVVYRFVHPVKGDIQRPVAVTPAISITLDHASELARAGSALDRFVNVTLRSALPVRQPVRVSLALPAGLTADSAARTVMLDSAATRRVTFRVRGRLAPGEHRISATASSGGASYDRGYIPIDYDHITPQRIYRPATVVVQAVDVQFPAGTSIGYVQGVGDNVAGALEQLGIPVTMIEPSGIPTVDLTKFSAVVVGPRAYDAHRELLDNNTYLLEYARNGGTLVVQYGQYEMMRPGVMPYAISISRPHDRVTEEAAPVRVLDAAAPALRQPNRIEVADFAGWVQERSLYMPRSFDEHYRPLVELSDPGAPSNRGGILVAPYGKGLYVYTTLAFFRQLPAGVSGATKLFVNLVSLRGTGPVSKVAGTDR